MSSIQLMKYRIKQKTLEIGGVKVGGLPGLTPTVLIGSVFYRGDKTVIDRQSGKVDKKDTEKLLQTVIEVSQKTSLPSMLDVVAETPEAMQKHLRFLVDAVDHPLLIDGSSDMKVNLAGLEAARDGGFMGSVILNSLIPEVGEEDYQSLKELGLQNALILSHSNAAITSATKRVEIAESILQRALEAGISNLLFDTGVLDLPTLGLACKAIQGIKQKLGYPAGCGAHNAVSTWKGLKPKFGRKAKAPVFVGSSLMPVSLGADFILYGPIKHASIVFPSVAMIDVALSGVYLETRERIPKPHPRYSIG